MFGLGSAPHFPLEAITAPLGYYSYRPMTSPRLLPADPAFYSNMGTVGETWNSLTQLAHDHATLGGAFPYLPYGGLSMSRKNATRESTGTLKAWLLTHIKNPYPTRSEKVMLAVVTNLTLTQVSTWFANARRRLKKDSRGQWLPGNRLGDSDDDDDVIIDNKDDFNQSDSSHCQDECRQSISINSQQQQKSRDDNFSQWEWNKSMPSQESYKSINSLQQHQPRKNSSPSDACETDITMSSKSKKPTDNIVSSTTAIEDVKLGADTTLSPLTSDINSDVILPLLTPSQSHGYRNRIWSIAEVATGGCH